jgi:hypothetical protein
MKDTTIAVDLARSVFEVAVSQRGRCQRLAPRAPPSIYGPEPACSTHEAGDTTAVGTRASIPSLLGGMWTRLIDGTIFQLSGDGKAGQRPLASRPERHGGGCSLVASRQQR